MIAHYSTVHGLPTLQIRAEAGRSSDTRELHLSVTSVTEDAKGQEIVREAFIGLTKTELSNIRDIIDVILEDQDEEQKPRKRGRPTQAPFDGM